MAEPKKTMFVSPAADQGSFVISSLESTALSAAYPTDGAGSSSTTASNALWTQNGLTAGTFETEITFVQVSASTTIRIQNPDGAAGEVYSFRGSVMSPMSLRIPGPFHVTKSTGTGGITIGFRIHKYRVDKV